MKYTKQQKLDFMRMWYIPNYFDKSMWNYTRAIKNDNKVLELFNNELKTYGNEFLEELNAYLNGKLPSYSLKE